MRPFRWLFCEMASVGNQVDDERKEAYYLRLHLLVVKYGTKILRGRFDHAIPPATLHQQLQNCIGKINFAKTKGWISQSQHQKLYPGKGPPTSEEFDISLLCYLLRNICSLDSKSQWWKQVDNSKIPETEQSEEADIQRIRNMRNYVSKRHMICFL